ncbi:MAG: TetR/AcrR family transcriptional regulator [Bacilli bacterium]|nr:TetR/AcrR family transcriptional regulator [Bacilli bacterium]
MDTGIREPKQRRAINKKDRIIEAGFELICENGYYNTNTAEIAKKADVSTGIVYQYFKDKHDILMEAIEKYGEDIFFPMLKLSYKEINITNFNETIRNMIENYVTNHKVSKIAHEEIMAMVHSDKDIADYYYKRELEMTDTLKTILIKNNFSEQNLYEKVHVMIGLIDNLCHEKIYHKHSSMNYDIMTDIVIENIEQLFKEDLKQ